MKRKALRPHRSSGSLVLVAILAAGAWVSGAAAAGALTTTDVYVAVNGSDSAPCTQAAPCATITRAIVRGGARTTVHVGEGTFTNPVNINAGTVTIIGSSTSTPTVLDVETATGVSIGGDAVVSLQHLNFESVSDEPGPPPDYDGVDVHGGKVTIASSSFSANAYGLAVFGGSVAVTKTTIYDSYDAGMYVDGGSATVNYSTIGGTFEFAPAFVVDGDTSPVVIAHSTVWYGGDGLDVAAGAAVNLVDSSVVNNTFTGINTAGTTSIVDSTISGSNNALNVGGGSTTLAGSIVDGNGDSPGSNCTVSNGAVLDDAGYNLSSDSSCSLSGTSAASSHIDLGPLADNGGLSQTIAPSSSSVAVDAIPATATAVLGEGGVRTALCVGTDQRGERRPQVGSCDIGAVELSATSTALVAPPLVEGIGVSTRLIGYATPGAVGTLSFYDGAKPISGCSGLAVGTSRKAVCTTSALTAGTHAIKLVFASTKGFHGSTSAQTVRVLPSYLRDSAYVNGSFQVSTGHTYTLVVTGTAQRPVLCRAVAFPGTPTKPVASFAAAGASQWTISVPITSGYKAHAHWNLGIKVGNVVHPLEIHVN